MPPPLFIDAVEIGVLQQSSGARKTHSRPGRRLLYTSVLTVDAHQLKFLHNGC